MATGESVNAVPKPGPKVKAEKTTAAPKVKAPPKVKAERKPKAAKAGQICGCGCKGTTKGGRFLPGHDARFHSAQKKAAEKAEAKTAKAPVAAGNGDDAPPAPPKIADSAQPEA